MKVVGTLSKWLIPLFYLLFFLGCGGHQVKPYEICKYNIQVSQMCPIDRFDTVEFLDLAIEVAKEKHFPPPMEYDKNNEKLMFGHEDVDTMPGHKMVVYMWTDDKAGICLNTLVLSDISLSEGATRDIMEDFISDLENRYRNKYLETEQLMKKYQNK